MKALPVVLAICATAVFDVSRAETAEDWTLRFGVHDVIPKSDNGKLAGGALKADLDDSLRPTASIEYRFTPNLGADLLVAWPFEHTLKLNGAKAATIRQLPPTLGINWHFAPDATCSPFVGIGVNFTRVFDEKTTGPLAGTNLSVGDSWGLAAHAGIDIAVAPRWIVTIDARWIDIDSTARVDGSRVGTVSVDPWAVGLSAGYRF
jgi:outer membrane protein